MKNRADMGQDHTQGEEQLSLLQTITIEVAAEVAAASDLASALEVVLRDVCEKTGWVAQTSPLLPSVKPLSRTAAIRLVKARE